MQKTDRPSTAHTIQKSPSTVEGFIELFHERGEDYESGTTEKTVTFDTPRQKVTVRSHFVGLTDNHKRSPAFLASTRRRLAQKIREKINDLAQHESDENGFATWTHAALERLRDAVQRLSDAEQYSRPEHEANSCEVFRQIRDTLLSDGWKSYREPSVRKASIDILAHLASADEVTADDADAAMDKLLSLGLNPSRGPILLNAETTQSEISG